MLSEVSGRTYPERIFLQEIKQMLEESGLVFLQAFDEYSNQEPRTDSGRIVVVAQENGKEKQEETE